MMKKIIDHIKNKYAPTTLIVYGSYADGSNNEHSDFDALIIADVREIFHDTSVVDNIQLDVFVYPTSYLNGEIDENEIVQIHDGKIIIDKLGVGEKLKQKVNKHINSQPRKNKKENADQIEWCKKMLLRTERSDVEGYFRWHWLLCDSLQIYFDICGVFYFGPKKAIKYMAETDFEAYTLYIKALEEFEYVALKDWIDFLDYRCNRLEK